ncbi:hypothetical protein KO527_05405 [Pseudoalteromonas sp. C2R02]|uniref:hypothetical protein n=1 Tax=Pseudoalteromonas sp. C2R02 TaxID=2841565 RepID=UPI001C098408|nr:hypothetical protein [Pseudoalteromonas sp. C2R02]MBU2968785.1 hypothetical protein [Pseudoalteromonas sp. C2R02]
MKINSSLSLVAQTVISAINSDATLSATSLGATNAFGAVVVSPKGAPFKVLPVNQDNWKATLGKPYHPSAGTKADCLRQLGESVSASNGFVVRAVAADAAYPIIHAHKSGGSTPFFTGTETTYGNTVATPAGSWATFNIIDGDSARTRKLSVTPSSDGSKDILIELFEDNPTTGIDQLIKDWTVNLSFDAVDDLGQPIYIETPINKHEVLSVKVDPAAIFSEVEVLDKAEFTKANDGGAITAADMIKALDLLHNSTHYLTAYVAMGLYEATYLQKLAQYSNERLIDCFADVSPLLTYAAALTEATSLGINNYHVSMHHFPVIAEDPYYGGEAIWGVSGAVFAAKAKGRNITTGGTIGVHYSPAGVDLATLPRANTRLMDGVGVPDYNAMVTARLNKFSAKGGNLFIDDSLTMWSRNDNLQLQHVGAVADEISKRFYQGSDDLRHKPDGTTERGLKKLLQKIGDDFVASGALVKPSDPANGDAEFTYEVKKASFDTWSCRWFLSITGTNRITIGEPILVG